MGYEDEEVEDERCESCGEDARTWSGGRWVSDCDCDCDCEEVNA